MEVNAPIYQGNPVSRTTSEERAECLKGWGRGWAGRGGIGRGGEGARKRIPNCFRSHRYRDLLYTWCKV